MAHLSDSSFPAVSRAQPPGADLSMTSLWRTGSSGERMETGGASSVFIPNMSCKLS